MSILLSKKLESWDLPYTVSINCEHSFCKKSEDTSSTRYVLQLRNCEHSFLEQKFGAYRTVWSSYGGTTNSVHFPGSPGDDREGMTFLCIHFTRPWNRSWSWSCNFGSEFPLYSILIMTPNQFCLNFWSSEISLCIEWPSTFCLSLSGSEWPLNSISSDICTWESDNDIRDWNRNHSKRRRFVLIRVGPATPLGQMTILRHTYIPFTVQRDI